MTGGHWFLFPIFTTRLVQDSRPNVSHTLSRSVILLARGRPFSVHLSTASSVIVYSHGLWAIHICPLLLASFEPRDRTTRIALLRLVWLSLSDVTIHHFVITFAAFYTVCRPMWRHVMRCIYAGALITWHATCARACLVVLDNEHDKMTSHEFSTVLFITLIFDDNEIMRSGLSCSFELHAQQSLYQVHCT